ncbi:MAG: hypothetical protein WCN98_20855, partial [Verrucomicrobiaceae bacterium]
LKRYRHEVIFNHLNDSSAEESLLVEMFARMIREVVSDGKIPQTPAAWLPSWNEVQRLMPDFSRRLAECIIA